MRALMFAAALTMALPAYAGALQCDGGIDGVRDTVQGMMHDTIVFEVVPPIIKLPHNRCVAHLLTSRGEFAWTFTMREVNGHDYAKTLSMQRWEETDP